MSFANNYCGATLDTAEQAFQFARSLPIVFDVENAPACRERAWEIAKQFNFATVYDAVYLALAEFRGCEFWTADQKLYERVKAQLPYVRCLEQA